jgi:protein arginine N-methyltransferase 1
VVDLGAGTGILSLIACRLGARRVYAIDNNEAIEVGRELARENGCADRIEFICDDSRKVTLPERAQVVVSDLHGPLPLAGDCLSAIADARERFLVPGGVLIPAREMLIVAVVTDAALYERALGPASAPCGVTLGAMRTRLGNSIHKDRGRSLRPENLVTGWATWATLDYKVARAEPLRGRVELTIARAVVAHGLTVWFDSVLHGQHGFTCTPGKSVVYPQLFFPWSEPTELTKGDKVAVELWAQPEGEPWGWNTEIKHARGSKTVYKQSSFLGSPARPAPSEVTALPKRGVAS